MKFLILTVTALAVLTAHAWGQGAQADQIKRRAKDLSNQNNTRQGVPPPAQPQRPPPAGVKPVTAKPASPPPQSVARLHAALTALKPGSPATAEQKQQLVREIIAACRGAIPSQLAVHNLVNDLAAALADKGLEPAQQSRLAQNLDAALNSAAMPVSQFEAVVADAQAILEAGGAKRNLAVAAANRLKAVGMEVRRGGAR